MKRLCSWGLVLLLAVTPLFANGSSEERTEVAPAETKVDVSATPESEKYGGTLTMALSAVCSNLDPIKYTSVYEDQVIRTVCDTLVSYDKSMKEMVGSLATSWSSNDAGDIYTFTLREGVRFQKGKFQDGRLMTAEDVKYSLERSASQSVMDRLAMLDHVEVINDHEVACYLKKPNASFIAALNNGGNVIVPKEEVEGWGAEFGAHLVGTGPFAMKQLVTDSSCSLVRSDDYWGPKPYLDGVTFRFVTDINMRVNALRSGEVDIANDLSGENINIVRNETGLKLNEVPGMKVSYVYMNLMDGPTKDKRVRTAIIKALDIDQIAKVMYQFGDGVRGYLPLPPGSWGYDASYEDLVPTYDPEAAKQLLSDAGYPDGFETDYYTSDSDKSIKLATILQQYLKKNLNIDMQIHTAQWGSFSAMASSGKAPLYGMSWTWDPDPYFYLNQMFYSPAIGSLGNGQGFNDPEVDRLLDEAVVIGDQAKRAELYKQALKIIVEANAQIDWGYSKVIDGLNDRVQGYVSYPDQHVVICSPEINTWLSKK